MLDIVPRMTAVLESMSERMSQMPMNAPSGSAGPGILCLNTPSLQMDVNVTLPASHLRLVLSSVRAFRNAAENLTTMIPVLTAAEQALNQHLQN